MSLTRFSAELQTVTRLKRSVLGVCVCMTVHLHGSPLYFNDI